MFAAVYEHKETGHVAQEAFFIIRTPFLSWWYSDRCVALDYPKLL
jgi:hypothetical protein